MSNPKQTDPAVVTENGQASSPSITGDVALLPKATDPQDVPKGAPLDHPHLFYNRELSWLDFNWRVLYQAMDERHPLLERVRFVAITANNLDEFFRKRVGGLKRQEGAGVRELSPDGRTPTEQLALIREAIEPMFRTLHETWEKSLRPALKEAGIWVRDYDSLTANQKKDLKAYFRSHIFPILTPLAVDPGHPFPFISNLSLSLAIVVRNPKRGTEHFARLKIPANRGRWVPLTGRPNNYVPLEQVIAHNVGELFRGMEVLSAHVFRITRNADLSRNEEEADDLLAMISDEVRERRFAPVVRLEVEQAMPEHVRHLLMTELLLDREDVFEVEATLDVTDLFKIADLKFPHLKFSPWEPTIPDRLQYEGESEDRVDLFAIIRNGDLLVHHPYESFSGSVQQLLDEAADDPSVLAIKQTLYRTSDQSPVVDALMRAAEHGKLVAVLVEVKARFDEENNIEWGQKLEKAGVHVTYGLVGLKTHTKTILIIREEADGLRTYCHIGTGNYNANTARLYTDLGLLTCRPVIGSDLVNLFHYLTGYAPEQEYEELIIAPRDMRNRFIESIRNEISLHKKNGNGQIIAKMNSMDDVLIIQELYRASRAGVQIDLIIRGHCRLRPGLPKFSENIRIISIIGRFLEHSRIYYFHNNGNPRTFMGSADWQRRNLDDRVEAILEVVDEEARSRMIEVLELALADNRLAWDLQADGQFIQRHPGSEEERNFHEALMRLAEERNHAREVAWKKRLGVGTR